MTAQAINWHSVTHFKSKSTPSALSLLLSALYISESTPKCASLVFKAHSESAHLIPLNSLQNALYFKRTWHCWVHSKVRLPVFRTHSKAHFMPLRSLSPLQSEFYYSLKAPKRTLYFWVDFILSALYCVESTPKRTSKFWSDFHPFHSYDWFFFGRVKKKLFCSKAGGREKNFVRGETFSSWQTLFKCHRYKWLRLLSSCFWTHRQTRLESGSGSKFEDR